MLSQSEIEILLSQLDGGSDAEWNAIRRLKEVLGPTVVPLLSARYSESKRAPIRASCVYHCMSFARTKAAVELGIRALGDRSKVVRYRACMLLSVALDPVALQPLRGAAAVAGPSQSDFLAAIDAIENQNRDYFVDRTHSGMIKLCVGDLD